MGAPDVTRTAVSGAARSRADALARLQDVSEVLGLHLGVELPVPLDSNPANLSIALKRDKEFSVAFLEGRPHPWTSATRRLPATTRLTVAGSLFLWRKLLPVVDSPTPAEHRGRVTAPELDLPPLYLDHVVRETRRIFPRGWDKGYISHIHTDVPTMKSVSENARSQGGWRAMAPDREQHAARCMGDLDPSDVDTSVRFSVAPCDGKERAVTVMSSTAQILKPLHKVLYDQISEQDWCLRGDAKAKSFSTFCRVPGEVFVSGDYESATDHLPVTVAEVILQVASESSRFVPKTVWEVAKKFLRPDIVYPDGVTSRATRQLMGSLLCFPLLCMQNYLAFRWVFPATTPVRINGDDIVFRARREQYERWAGFVASVGLRLSAGKTSVSSTYFSLNSTFFRATERYVRLVPVVRFSSLSSSKCTFPNSLRGAHSAFLRGFKGEVRESLSALWLKVRGGLIRKSGRSVVRGLGILATDKALKSSGLWYRELWYLNSVPADRFGRELALPQPPTKLEGKVRIPPGWRRVSAREARGRLDEETEFFDELLELAWQPGELNSVRDLTQEYFIRVSATGFESQWRRWKKTSVRRPLYGSLPLKSRLKSKPFYALQVDSYRKEVWVRDPDASSVLLLAALPFREVDARAWAPIRFSFGGVESSLTVASTDVSSRPRLPVEAPCPTQKSRCAPRFDVGMHMRWLRSRLEQSVDLQGEEEEALQKFKSAARRCGVRLVPDEPAPQSVAYPPPACLTESSWLGLEERLCQFIQ